MESFTLTRVEMSSLLLSLTGMSDRKPLNILQEAWTKFHHKEVQEGASLPDFLSTDVPPILQKIVNGNSMKGFSLGEIASLGHLIEYSTLSVTAMQNWVKRDFKEYLGSPRIGKKYSVNQAALLFIIDDLKSALSFDNIRQLFQLMFLNPDRDDDDLMEPAKLYYAYSCLFEEIKCNPTLQSKYMIDQELYKEYSWKDDHFLRSSTDKILNSLTHLTKSQRESVRNILLIATIAVQTCYFQALATQYFNAALFLDF